MDFEIVRRYGDFGRKVVEVLPRRHNAEKSWEAEEILIYEWFGEECYTYSESGKATLKTGADYKREIASALEKSNLPKACSPEE